MVAAVMTQAPQTIGADMTVETARCMMREFGVRHLPVRADGRLVGVVAAADLSAPAHRLVAEVMRREPWVVAPTDDAAGEDERPVGHVWPAEGHAHTLEVALKARPVVYELRQPREL